MSSIWMPWRLWDQARARENARASCVELTRSRAEREEVDAFVAVYLRGSDKAHFA
jgi:hypothetical protein